jgi:hypothetical protein
LTQDRRDRGRRTLVSGHEDLGVHLQVLRKEVSQGVVLLAEEEVGRIGHAWRGLVRFDQAWTGRLTRDGLFLKLLLALGENEELETGRRSACHS